jgi:hypothetical protein
MSTSRAKTIRVSFNATKATVADLLGLGQSVLKGGQRRRGGEMDVAASYFGCVFHSGRWSESRRDLCVSRTFARTPQFQ